MGGAPTKHEVQRVIIEIKGRPKPKPKEWSDFKRDIKKVLGKYRSIKAKIVEIDYLVKMLNRR